MYNKVNSINNIVFNKYRDYLALSFRSKFTMLCADQLTGQKC